MVYIMIFFISAFHRPYSMESCKSGISFTTKSNKAVCSEYKDDNKHYFHSSLQNKFKKRLVTLCHKHNTTETSVRVKHHLHETFKCLA